MHTGHHTYTLIEGKDTQLPTLPATLRTWLLEVSGLELMGLHLRALLRLAFNRYTEPMQDVIPRDEMPRIRRNAWIFIGFYAAICVAIALGVEQLLWYLVIPVFLGQVTVVSFGLVQHVEMAKNAPSIIDSTRSFRTNPMVSFLYLNMEHHVEHHLYPQVPFYSLPALNRTLSSQLPEPDPGFLRTFIESLSVAIRRTLGGNTRAWSIRQAPHLITGNSIDPATPGT
jgi:fatty acid desaturase